jgi:hypothetical protein
MTPMNPHDALDEQIAKYRLMSGEERLGIALALHELACDIARAGIRARHPEADDAEVERQLRSRIAMSRRPQEPQPDDARDRA